MSKPYTISQGILRSVSTPTTPTTERTLKIYFEWVRTLIMDIFTVIFKHSMIKKRQHDLYRVHCA